MRLVTRPDFDGLVCGSLITAMESIDTYLFVEPKWMQDGMVKVRRGDIIANLPYHPDCSLWFDHHLSNEVKGFNTPVVAGKGGYRLAPSAARVVFEYYDTVPTVPAGATGLEKIRSQRFHQLLEDTDKIDAGLLTHIDVLHPQGYVLISMTIDGKRTEDEPYWLKLIALLRDRTLEVVLADQEIKRQCQRILGLQAKLKELLLERVALKGNVIYADFRGIADISEANRFLIYTLFPKGNISLKVSDDTQKLNRTAISVGYNIFNTTSKVNVGALMKKYGGGGHRVVGSCRVAQADADQAVKEVLEAIQE
ncbi:MAG TPA: exopolyphosphatase [Candidatus Binatia bacterium]